MIITSFCSGDCHVVAVLLSKSVCILSRATNNTEPDSMVLVELVGVILCEDMPLASVMEILFQSACSEIRDIPCSVVAVCSTVWNEVVSSALAVNIYLFVTVNVICDQQQPMSLSSPLDMDVNIASWMWISSVSSVSVSVSDVLTTCSFFFPFSAIVKHHSDSTEGAVGAFG